MAYATTGAVLLYRQPGSQSSARCSKIQSNTSASQHTHPSRDVCSSLQDSSSPPAKADVAICIKSSNSIYDLHSHPTRWLVLLAIAVAALLVPFTGTGAAAGHAG